MIEHRPRAPIEEGRLQAHTIQLKVAFLDQTPLERPSVILSVILCYDRITLKLICVYLRNLRIITHITAIIHEFIILSLIVLDECHVLEPLFCGDIDHKVGTLPPCNSIPSSVHAKMGMPRLSQ